MQINLRASAHANGPLRSVNNYQFGFYDIGCLRQALQESGESFYRVGSVKIPKTQWEFNEVQELINHPSVQYALVDKNKVVFVQVGNNTEWLSVFTNMGYSVKGGEKTAKRLKSFHRPTLLNANFDLSECRIKLVDDPSEFSRYEFGEGYTEEEIERLLDGGMIISERLIAKAVKNIPNYTAEETSDPNEYFYNPRVRHELINGLLHTKAFNVRIITPDGMLKGNAFVSKRRLPEDADVVSWLGNLKPEVSYSNGMRFLAEPQTAKSRVHTDDQTMANFPMLFTKEDMELWLKEEYEKLFNSSVNDEALMNWKNVYQRSWRDRVNPEDEESQARMNYVGYRWRAMGMKVTDSPWLFETLAIGGAKPLEEKIPIACAVYEQIISESMARMAGFDISVEEGHIRRLNQLEVHVVNDIDWIEMYASHGGCDQDDFFKLFYRTMVGGERDGQKVVIAMRSPNGFGEYSIFKYTEGDWFPKWKMSDGTEKEFLPVSGRGWPKRLSQAIADGEVNYTGLPSQNNFSVKQKSEYYTRESVISDLRASMSTGTVGKFVNATMLWASVFQKHRPLQTCSLEDAIDGYVQTNVVEDRECIDEDADRMVREVIESRLPVDRSMWDAVNRNFSKYLKQGEWVEKHEGTITQMNTLCRKYFNEFSARVRAYSQTNIKILPLVETLGYRMHFTARHDLKKFRQLIMNTNSQMTNDQGGHIDRQGWDFIYQTIVDKINSYDLENDRHDYALGLYYVTMKDATSSGKITDQIVMNRLVFPYLERALQFYGIGKSLDIMQGLDGNLLFRQNRVTTWQGIDPETMTVTEEFNDPVLYQKYMIQRSPIIHSNAS